MKSYCLVLMLLLVSVINNGFASNNKEKVDIEEVIPDKPHTRSLIQKPTVYIDTDIKQLSITFISTEKGCNVYILNDGGIIVYQSLLTIGGSENMYNLSTLDSGNYKIIIECQHASYEGFLLL